MSNNYPTVITEWQTVELLGKGYSIARYGDGELKLCRGAAAKAQAFDINLSRQLQEILKFSGSCLVGIPRIFAKGMPPQKRQFWEQYTRPQYTDFYCPQMWYASSFITRPDSIPEIDTPSYWESIRRIWEGRHVVLINGDNKRFDKNPKILEFAASWERWVAPSQNAWAVYSEILTRCIAMPTGTVFILALGPTATVLAYDLCRAGYQALDLGHLGMFYADNLWKARQTAEKQYAA